MSLTLDEIAKITSTKLVGKGSCTIHQVADLIKAEEGTIAFVSGNKYKKYIESTNASALIITEDLLSICSKPALVTDDPRLLYAKVVELLHPVKRKNPHISESASIAKSANVFKHVNIDAYAVIHAGAVIGEGVHIGSGSVIGENVVIGANTNIYPNVTIYDDCVVGENVVLHANSVIGADGFGFVKNGDNYLKIPQLGVVRIGDDVEVGANTSIDRGALEDTIISDGVKLDNQIQIGHSVSIGKNTVVSASTAIAGSTKIGENCLIGGLVGIADHLTICDDVMITGKTLVSRSITAPGSYSSGTPIDETRNWRKNSARFRKLDELSRRVKKIENKSD